MTADQDPPARGRLDPADVARIGLRLLEADPGDTALVERFLAACGPGVAGIGSLRAASQEVGEVGRGRCSQPTRGEPSRSIVELARDVAGRSPCAKSRRGVVACAVADDAILGTGYNGPPGGGTCAGDDQCRSACGRLCVHAELRAIRRIPHGAQVYLVHVKLGPDGAIVPGGGPSCWQCSREILDVGCVAGVWLFQAPQVIQAAHQGMHPAITRRPGGPGRWTYHDARAFHAETLRACGLASRVPDQESPK